METASWISRVLASSRSTLPPSHHVLPAPDFSTAGLGGQWSQGVRDSNQPWGPQAALGLTPLALHR